MNLGDYRAVGRAAATVPTPQGYPLERKWELHALRVNPDHKCLESKKVKGERLGWHGEDSSSMRHSTVRLEHSHLPASALQKPLYARFES